MHIFAITIHYLNVKTALPIAIGTQQLPLTILEQQAAHTIKQGTLPAQGTSFFPPLSYQKNDSDLGIANQLLDRVTDMIIATDEQWRITYINTHAENTLHIRAARCLGMNLWSCFPKILNTEIEDQYRRAMKTGVPANFDVYFAPFNKWYGINAYPAPTGLSIFFRDVSGRYQAEAELRSSNERFKLAAKSDAIYDWNIQSDELHWDDGLQNLFGYASADFQIKDWEAGIHPNDQKKVVAALFDALGDGQRSFWSMDYRMKRKDGSYCYVFEKGHILRNANGKATRMVGNIQDISDRKKTEAELFRLSLVAQQTNNIVAITAPDGILLWVNDAFVRQTGYTPAEVIGKKSTEVFDGPETDPATIKLVAEKFLSREPFHIQVLNYKKNGTTYWSDLSCQPVFDENGELLHFFSIATDITEKKKLQQVLEKEKRKRQQMITAAAIKIQERERAQVGLELHDNVNQILTTVKLYNELCRDGLCDVNTTLNKSVSLLQTCIDEVRALSKRLSAPSLGKVKLYDSVTELVQSVRGSSRLEINLYACAIAHLSIDQERHLGVYRILQEHFTNIIKHARAKTVNLSIEITGDLLCVRIQDDGKGFDASAKRSGIGLTNMQTRAESLQGSLSISSAIGEGCTLLVELPLH